MATPVIQWTKKWPKAWAILGRITSNGAAESAQLRAGTGELLRLFSTLRQMQAFEAKPPPLTTGPEGVIRVSGTRVSLETVVYAFDAGSTAEEIVQQYPSLSLGNVYAIISYVLDNRQSVDEYVARRREKTDALRAEIEARFPPEGLRARLLARGAKAPGG